MKLSAQDYSDYRAALARYLEGGGEETLSDGYETGRQVMANGLGVLEIASLHYEALAHLLQSGQPSNAAELVRTAGAFLVESLTAFEISHRGIAEMNDALRRLNELVEEDLKRVGRALHDQAGNILALASLELDLIAEELSAEDRGRLALARQLLDETGEQLRHFSHELRPTLLDDLGLAPALENLAEGIEQRSTLRVQVSTRIRGRPSRNVETALYRIVQEALNNAVRHAGPACTVTIMVERDGDKIRCNIVDDGSGFDPEAISGAGRGRSMGIAGMRERAYAVGGSFDIRSAPGGGTSIEVIVPVLARGNLRGT